MIAKLANFVLVLLLSFVNFVIMLLPLAVLVVPIAWFFGIQWTGWITILSFLAFGISAYMLIYLLFDFLFGVTVTYQTKTALAAPKAKFIDGHDDILEGFAFVQKRFNCKNVKLYFSQSLTPNAYAVGSMRKKAVILTLGLIQQLYDQSANRTQYIDAVRSIMAHEMSHLVNKDFLPGLLIHSNRVAHRFLSSVIRKLFMAVAFIFRIIPLVGFVISTAMNKTYQLVDFITSLFLKLAFMPIYRFLSKWFGRSIEYRCDKDAAKIFGGRVVAQSLSMLGKGAYFTIFSTHPGTQARMNHVKNVMPKGGVITASLLTQLMNAFMVLSLVFLTLFFLTQLHLTQIQMSPISPLMDVVTMITERVAEWIP